MDDIRLFAYKSLASLLAGVDGELPDTSLRNYCRKAAEVISTLVTEQQAIEDAQRSGSCPWANRCAAVGEARKAAVSLACELANIKASRPRQEVIIFENIKPRRPKNGHI